MDLRDLTGTLSQTVASLERDLPYASALCTRRSGVAVRVTGKQAAVEPTDPMLGCVLSAFTGRAFVEVSTTDLAPAGMAAAAAQLRSRALEAGVDPHGPVVDPGPPLQRQWTTHEQVPAADVPLADKVARAHDLRARVGRDPRTVHSVARIGDVQSQELFVNRTRTLFQDLRRAEAVAFLVMQDGPNQAELYGGRSRAGGFEHCQLTDALMDEIVHDCGRLMGAGRVEPGLHHCVFAPDFAGLFAHEAFGHGTEADMFLKRRARGQQYLGKRVASDLVNMFDSPALPGHAATFHFDHEGQLAGETQIIRDGVLLSAITNLDAALRLGLPRTSNGRRESFERKVYTRMTNTYFGGGCSSVEEVFAGVDQGLFITHGSNGMEDPKGWGIQCEGYLAEEIRGGKRTGKVFSPVIVTGFVPDLLQSISAVSREVEITGLGMCGKGHKEWVKVTDGGPYLRLHARVA
ncbi:MAG: TldD/PmbA family protein [Deltaproteobacteria bacterium]|nr:TldD/PmbA family protein [Deltaproteobacteria bacterium]